MPLIDKSYFVGEINIPDTNKASVEERLDWFITKYENDFMRMALPYDLYDDYKNDNLDDDILYGDEYSIGTEYFKYDGLISAADAPVKFSPIANYVYVYWMKDKSTLSTGIGEAKPKGENSSPVNNVAKIAHAWNQMVHNVHALWHFIGATQLVTSTGTTVISSDGYRGIYTRGPEIFYFMNSVL